jgi:hypothetical protein
MNHRISKLIRHHTASDTPEEHVNRVARIRRRYYTRCSKKQRAELRKMMRDELNSN